MPRVSASIMWMMLTTWLMACPKQEQVRGPSQREVAAVQDRSADAFASLDAAERGEPEPAKRPTFEDEPPIPTKPNEPEQPQVAQKPVETVPVNPARSAPGWTNAQPNMPGYYVGIGVALGRGDDAGDWARARNSAYVELASSLKVHISSVVSDYFKENNKRLYKGDNITSDASRTDSSYAQDTKFFVDSTLEGVEIADRWKDVKQNKYWMLVRLSKAEILRRLQERLENARKKALDYVRAAIKAEASGNLSGALTGYFRSYLALREYFGGVVEYDVNRDGKPDVLNHEIERSIDRLMNGLSFKPQNANKKSVNGSGLAEPLVVSVTYHKKPVSSLPLVFAFQRGKGSIEGKVVTQEDGTAQAQVVKVFGDKKAIIASMVDLDALLDTQREANIVKAKFGRAMDRQTGKFIVELEELSAYIDIDEEMFGRPTAASTVAADIKDLLHAELGLVFTKNKTNADLEITGHATVGRCSDFFAERQCEANVTVTVTDRVRGRQLFSKKYKVKGNGEKDVDAGRVALGKIGKKVGKKIVQSMK